MEGFIVDDLAAQEAAAREYEPELKGPLIGERTPSHVITEDYAKADKRFVQKTLTLPQTYPQYRPVQGDGNCGWRAIGFAYFETLVRQGSKAVVDAELARLRGLNDYIMTVGGYEAMTFEDFADETFDLLRETSEVITSTDMALEIVCAKFNDDAISNSIVYHLRMLAASYMKGNAEVFAGFVPGGKSVEAYCSDWLERPGKEIEQIGIILLVDILLKPVNFTLEIAMLDRTEGAEVNTFRFPAEATGEDPSTLGPMICLLYRPDHYDILYRESAQPISMPVEIPPVDIAANFLTIPTANYKWADSTLGQNAYCGSAWSDALFTIPGFAPPPTSNFGGMLKTPIESPVEQAFTPSPVSSWLPPAPFGETLAPPAESSISALPSPPQSIQSVQTTSQVEGPRLKPDPESRSAKQNAPGPRRRRKTKSSSPQTQQQAQSQLASHSPPLQQQQNHCRMQALAEVQQPAPSVAPLVRNPPHPAMTGGDTMFRVSAFSIRSWEDHAASIDPCAPVPVYQNSHFHTAHFNNPNFQPEEYCPGIKEDGTVARSAGLRKRSRSPGTGRPLPFRKRTL